MKGARPARWPPLPPPPLLSGAAFVADMCSACRLCLAMPDGTACCSAAPCYRPLQGFARTWRLPPAPTRAPLTRAASTVGPPPAACRPASCTPLHNGTTARCELSPSVDSHAGAVEPGGAAALLPIPRSTAFMQPGITSARHSASLRAVAPVVLQQVTSPCGAARRCWTSPSMPATCASRARSGRTQSWWAGPGLRLGQPRQRCCWQQTAGRTGEVGTAGCWRPQPAPSPDPPPPAAGDAGAGRRWQPGGRPGAAGPAGQALAVCQAHGQAQVSGAGGAPGWHLLPVFLCDTPRRPPAMLHEGETGN